MSRSVHLFLVLIVALTAQSAVVRENNAVEMFRQGRTSTITKTVTITATTPSTTVISTKLTCAILVNPVSTTACRRKRQYWGVPLFYPFSQNDMQQFDTFNPSQVLGVQPSVMPEYRNKPSLLSDSDISQQFNYPFAIQSSIEGNADGVAPVQTMFRIADPFFFAPLSSLVANIVSSILTPPATVTSTQTVYTTTLTQSSFTATATYSLTSIPCLPSQVNICPANPIVGVGASDPLLAAAPVISAPAVAAPVASSPPVAAPVAAPVASSPPVAAPVAAPAASSPPVTAPVAAPVASSPSVAAPVAAPAASSPPVAAPVAAPVASSPPVAAPVASSPPVAAPVASSPPVAAPVASSPPVATPSASSPAVAAPVASSSAVAAPAASSPAVATPVASPAASSPSIAAAATA